MIPTIPFTTTFYSYKGGVGRTILAANVAVELSRRGKTLLWDLDIEAPGLHRIEGLRANDPADEGLFEWLLRWQNDRRFDDPTARDLSALMKCVRPAQGAVNLTVLPAHGHDANFPALYQQIDWHRFLVEDADLGLKLMRALLDNFARVGYEHVVIDSRTGITDIGGFLAALLPHVTVLVGNFGVQNAAGLKLIWDALQPAAERNNPIAQRIPPTPLTRLLVASPVPIGDVERVDRLAQTWATKFGLVGSDVIKIPYDERLRYAESLLTLTNPESATAEAYVRVASAILGIQGQHALDTESSARAEAERPEQFGRARGSMAERGKRFEERVAHVLRLLGYRVEPEQTFDANRIDLVARKRLDFEEVTYFVECKDLDRVAGLADIVKLGAWLAQPEARAVNARGMIVAQGFSQAGLSIAESHGIRTLTPDGIERELIDFSVYLARLCVRYEQSALGSCYVDQMVEPESEPNAPRPILPYALEWATGKERSRLWVLLGDYGTGKTAFTQRFAYELAKACESDRSAPVPILINLRDFANKTSIEDVLHEHWAAATGERLDPAILLHLLARGRIVLLLDSFDEMGIALVGKSVVEQFRALVRPSGESGEGSGGNRLLITCREQFFRERSEVKRAAAGQDDSLRTALVDAARGFDGTIDSMPRFSDAQIQEYLAKRLGDREGAKAYQFIEKTYNLKSLADRPQLLEIIVHSLPRLAARGGAVTSGALYLEYTNEWLERFGPRERQAQAEELRQVLEVLAGLLWGRAGNRIHYGDLFDRIRSDPRLRGSLDPGQMDLELRTAAFLSRSADGYYAFSHRSFLEFFFARRLLRAVEQNDLAAALDTDRVTTEVVDFLGDLGSEELSGGFRAALRRVLSEVSPRRAAVNAVIMAYRLARRTVGQRSGNSDEPREFSHVPPAMQEWMPKRAELAGCDMSDLDLRGAWLATANLSAARFERSDLSHADLGHAQLAQAVLAHATMSGINLRSADLRGADVRFVQADGATLTEVTVVESSWVGASLRGVNAANANFGAADFRAATLSDLVAPRSEWGGARLEGAVGPRSIGVPDSIRGLYVDSLTGTLAPRHAGFLYSAVFSPDGARLVTASADHSARVWDAATGRALLTLEGHGGAVNSAAFSPDGTRLVTASHDRSARVWDAATGRALLTIEGHSEFVEGATFSLDGSRLVTASADHSARIWDAITGRALVTLEGHTGKVSSAAFSPDGTRVVTASYDHSARVWDADTGRSLLNLEGHTQLVSSAAFSPDGTRVVTSSADNSARIWDAATGHALLTLDEHVGWLYMASFSPDGTRLVTASLGQSARVWDAATGRGLLALDGHTGWINSAVFSPDGRRLVTVGDDRTVRIWDAATGRTLLIIVSHHASDSTVVAFSPDGTRLVTARDDQWARVWDAATGRVLLTLEGHTDDVRCAAFSPDGTRLVTASADHSARVWDAATGRALLTLTGHTSWVRSAAFSPDGTRVVTATDEHSVRVWDAATGSALLTLEGHTGGVNTAAFSPDGTRLVTASNDRSARVWDAATGRALLTLESHASRVMSAAFSPDGMRLVTASGDQTAQIWDTATGRALLILAGHTGWVTSAAFSPDGTRLVTASGDQSARVWDTATGLALLTLEGHSSDVNSAAFSPDGMRLVTASSDNTTRIWDATSGEEIMQLVAVAGGWFSLHHAGADTSPRFRAEGEGLRALRYRDRDELPQPSPWIPREWMALDLIAELGLPLHHFCNPARAKTRAG